MKRLFLFIAIPLLLSSCSHPKGLVFKGVENPHINLRQHTPFRVDLKLYNPNHHTVSILSASGDIHLNNNYLGHFVLPEGFTVRKRHATLIPVTINADIENEFPAIQKSIKDSSVFLRFDGSITAGKGNHAVSSTMFYEGTQPMERDNARSSVRKRKN